MTRKAEHIFLAGVQSVLPGKLIRHHLKMADNTLIIHNERFYLPDYEHIYIIGAGKASALMAKEIETILGDRITSGHIITKYGHATELKRIDITEAGHPIPDEKGISATKKIVEIVQKAAKNDLVICLISGGASALMADYPNESSLDDLKKVNRLLTTCGATIQEINTVRKHLSGVKGGQLTNIIYPATVVSLILSDLVGDSLDVIASGPTVGDSTTFADALAVVDKYGLKPLFPVSMYQHMQKGSEGKIPETPKPKDPLFDNIRNILIGNNLVVLESAAKKARECNFETHIITDSLQGDYIDVAHYILNTIQAYQQKKQGAPICLLFGGEPTVSVSGKGLGGRNQHLALYMATKLKPGENVTILCAGTDGTDGPTDAAGAVIDDLTIDRAVLKNLDAEAYLTKSDSYHFFQQAGGHIITGNTGTNVMDMIVALVY